jgi:hypothetical protein
MKNKHRDLLVLLKNEFMDEHAIEQEVASLNYMLHEVESDDSFCMAHELVHRNRITNRKNKILKASRQRVLSSFCFLLNKN